MTVFKEINIPVVNFSEFSSGSASTRQDCANKILEAFTTVGFVYLSNALPPESIDKAFSLSKEFFGKPLEEKKNIEWESFVGRRGFVVKGFLPFSMFLCGRARTDLRSR
jgi:isopenicillin N synthase-like dioxygenase